MFWGTIADKVGRRPIFLACLLTLCLSCVGLAMTPTNAYWLLVLLRCLQAGGSASTIALGIYTLHVLRAETLNIFDFRCRSDR
jgi:MFS family permease